MSEPLADQTTCPDCGTADSLGFHPNAGVWFTRVNGREVALVGVPCLFCSTSGCLYARSTAEPSSLALSLALMLRGESVRVYQGPRK